MLKLCSRAPWIVVVVGLFAGCGASDAPSTLPHCWIRSYSAQVAVNYFDKVDVLFVIDDSPTMAKEQSLLQREVPRMLNVLLHGSADVPPSAGSRVTVPAEDLHIAVVSTDMGTGASLGVPGCSMLGDDGVLRHDQRCSGSGNFVWNFSGYHDPAVSAAAVSCNVDLGATGCSFAQPLEAMLKALSPVDPRSFQPLSLPAPVPPTFLDGTHGHALIENAGFLRSDYNAGLGALWVIVITDGDDCSARDPKLFTPPEQLDAGDPLQGQTLGERCMRNPDRLQPIKRYVDGLRAHFPGNESMVQLAVIAGVPTDLIEGATDPRADWTLQATRDSFYASVRNDPRMQPVAQAQAPAEPGASLRPSCTSTTAIAYPPRRLLELTQAFGQNGIVRSLCAEDLTQAVYDLLGAWGIAASHRDAVCFPHSFPRNTQGLTTCHVSWELPAVSDPGQPLTPSSCSDRPGVLSTPTGSFPKRSAAGRTLCDVRQLRVTPDAATGILAPEAGEGFYVDDFSQAVKVGCYRGTARAAFTAGAKCPSGVTVHINCQDVLQSATTGDAGGADAGMLTGCE